MRKITITEALNELKLYDAKINKAINDSVFVSATKKSSDKVGTMKRENFEKKASESYQSVNDLIRNRRAIKSAIVLSNAVTTVTVGGETMTVAEAIERKSSIFYEINLLAKMKVLYTTASSNVIKENTKVDLQVDKMLESMYGKDSDKKITEDMHDAIAKPYRATNEYELVDPIAIEDKIRELDDRIEKFKSEVDTVLSVANAITFIDVE